MAGDCGHFEAMSCLERVPSVMDKLFFQDKMEYYENRAFFFFFFFFFFSFLDYYLLCFGVHIE